MNSILLVTDFDGTITKQDTTILSRQASKEFREGSILERSKILSSWEDKGREYYKDYKILLKCLLQECKLNRNLSYDGLINLVSSLDSYNLQSRENLAKKNIFTNMIFDRDVLEELVTKIEYHTDALATIERICGKDGVSCKVLSVNWFPELLQYALKKLVKPDDIVASCLPVSINGHVDVGKVMGSDGKQGWIRKWKENNSGKTIYVGDSLTDLLALLEANYAIVFGSNCLLKEVLMTFSIPLIPLDQVLLSLNESNIRNKLNGTRLSKILCITNSWKEVELFVDSLLNVKSF